MQKTFQYWDTLYKNETMEEFNSNHNGLLWLKLKSIIRKDLVDQFLKFSKLKTHEKKLNSIFQELFILLSNNTEYQNVLDNFIIYINDKQISSICEEKLVSELYQLKHFEWGGDYQNSLDKCLISRYIKINDFSYTNLISKLDTEIGLIVKGYVLNSWYNYWSSVLIENIFKSHTKVLPTIGKIKSVDFFIDGIPFDLKVTYLPSEYLKQKRKENKLPNELTYLKQQAKKANISFNSSLKDIDIFYEITEKMKDNGNDICISTLDTLKQERCRIINEIKSNPKNLIQWLYENQGEMRFGSENRIFLVLIDNNDIHASWKLKRNIQLLKPAINSYLDNFSRENISDLDISFNYKNKIQTFNTLSDIIFVEKLNVQ